jgi:hypothetical protein
VPGCPCRTARRPGEPLRTHTPPILGIGAPPIRPIEVSGGAADRGHQAFAELGPRCRKGLEDGGLSVQVMECHHLRSNLASRLAMSRGAQRAPPLYNLYNHPERGKCIHGA